MNKFTSLLVVLTLTVLGNACASGDSGPRIASIAITPGSVTFGGQGETYLLSAQAYNAAGDEVAATFEWTTSDADTVSVDADGVLTSTSRVGSAVIVAQAEGTQSAPLLAMVVVPAPSSEFVDDGQVVGNFTLVDPSAPLVPGVLYEVTLSGIVPPDVGTILLGRETAPVAGEVVDTRLENEYVVVTLELLPLDELFDEMKVDEILPLRNAEVAIGDAASDAYTMERQPEGNYVLTLTAQARSTAELSLKAATESFGPFDCEADITSIPLTLDALPTSFGLTADLDFILSYDSNLGGLQKLSVKGDTKAEFKVSPTLTAAFEGKLGCKIELLTITIPVGGPLAWFFGGQVPLGAGFELSGKFTLAQLGAEVATELVASAEIGMACPGGGECTMINEFSSDAKADYKWLLPATANGDAQLRIEPSLSGFLFFKVAMGSKFFEALRFDTFIVKGGLTQGANLSTVATQVGDDGYASDYKLTLDVSAGLASDAQLLFNFLNVNVAAFELKYSLLLFESPKAASATADVESFEEGDVVSFSVALDANTLDYLVLTDSTPYNVDEIVIYRKETSGGLVDAQEVARASATFGQTNFTLTWEATDDGTIQDNFFVFVDTKALAIPLSGGQLGLPFLDELEIAKVQPGSEGETTVELTGAQAIKDCRIETQDTVGNTLIDQSDRNTTDYTSGGGPAPTTGTLTCSLSEMGPPRASSDSRMTFQTSTGPLSASLSMQSTATISVQGTESIAQDFGYADGELGARYTWNVSVSEPHSFTLSVLATGGGVTGVEYDENNPADYGFVEWDTYAEAFVLGHPVASVHSRSAPEDVPMVTGVLQPGSHSLTIYVEWDPAGASSKDLQTNSPSGSAAGTLTLSPM